MITPSEINDKSFKNGIGYDKKDVEQFLTEIKSDYETVLKENEDLKKKVNELNENISYYKSIEKTLQKALVLAEKTAQDTIAAARKDANIIEAEAKAKARDILSDVKGQIEFMEHKTLNLMQQYDLFKIHFKNLLNSQIELLNSNSFSVDVKDFLYKGDDLISQVELLNEKDELSEEEISSNLMEEGIIFNDFIDETKEQRIETDDGFEFITLKDE